MSKVVNHRVDNAIVISIKPTYADLIMSGEKTVELRRRFSESMQVGTEVFIYSSSPVKGIVGQATIKKIIKKGLEDLWREVGKCSGVNYTYFRAYFEGLEEGYGILLEEPVLYEKQIPLEQLTHEANFSPPQSYMFASQQLMTLVKANA